MSKLITVSGVNGYIDEDGTAWLNTEAVARGLAFIQMKDGKEYVRWERVNGYLTDMGFPHLVGKEFIPENVFYRLSMKGETESARLFQAKVADEILPSIRKTGSYSAQNLSPQLQLLINMELKQNEMAREIAETKESQQRQTAELTTVKHRLDNMDSLDTIGDLQQRLNAMIRKYAGQKGIGYSAAWREFIQSYNTAYRTNLTASKNNYEEKQGKTYTTPGYLNVVGKLDDAIRVADKMLNRE